MIQPTTNTQSTTQSCKSHKTKSNGDSNGPDDRSNHVEPDSDSDYRSFEVDKSNVTHRTSLSKSDFFKLQTDPTVPVIIASSSRFAKSFDYHYYRLNNMSDRFPASLTTKLSKYSTRLKAHMSVMNFSL